MITVQDVLNRKHFDCAKVVAGEKGLARGIKWVHILEIVEVKQLIQGNELVLTTGVVLKDNEQGFLSFIEQLNGLHVAGLCVELGEYIAEIPQSVIKLADRLHFPLIVFTEVVKFIEITQDVHAIIIHQQFEALKRLEDYAQQINKYSLKINDINQILLYMQRYLQVNVVLELKNQSYTFIPNKDSEYFLYYKDKESRNIACCELNLFQQPYGKVYIYSPVRELTDFDTLILDRTIVTLSQCVLRDLYIEEKSESEYRQFLENWVNGKSSNEEISLFLDEWNPRLKEAHWIVMIHQLKREIKKKDITYYKITIRKALEKEGFQAFTVEQSKRLIFIVCDIRGKGCYKERLKRAWDESVQQAQFEAHIGVGRYVSHFNQLEESFLTAQDTVGIRWKKTGLSYFYEDLYLYHLVQVLQQNHLIMRVAEEKIDLLQQYDQKYNSNLIHTLKVYLRCNGLKKDTAEKLFIVRQTLYHRLEKIEQILGSDFMAYENRLYLEMVLLMTEKNYTG
ncbi:PucR family transcriptional regulator [Lysinibacillus sp. 54212]|uniref:PucR family transcriptional regulator n=1 Tax=Lysinibacillus sp. 54212 TaxID=3119829 RepID=UPI002FCC6203